MMDSTERDYTYLVSAATVVAAVGDASENAANKERRTVAGISKKKGNKERGKELKRECCATPYGLAFAIRKEIKKEERNRNVSKCV